MAEQIKTPPPPTKTSLTESHASRRHSTSRSKRVRSPSYSRSPSPHGSQRRSQRRSHRRHHYRSSPSRSPSPIVDESERDLRTVFAMQLSARLRRSDLVDFFSPSGRVRDAHIVAEKGGSRRSRGVAYIEFYDVESAQRAVQQSGQRLLDVPIIVQPSEAQKNRQSTMKRYTADGAPLDQVDNRLLIVRGLAVDIEPSDLAMFFEIFGKVEYCFVYQETEDDGARDDRLWAAFVRLELAQQATVAVEKLNGLEIFGRRIRVRVARKSEQQKEQARLAKDTRTDDTGKQSEVQAETTPAPVSPAAPAVGRVLVLHNMFDLAEEQRAEKDGDDGSEWKKDIEDDVAGECAGFGAVERVNVMTESNGLVYVYFAEESAAETARAAMDKRWFGGRQISAVILPNDQAPAV
ncbi:splicing factor [Coemansia sp. Benny D115]|nr:splicing factor [Coemansia sp. Benny D115]